MEELLRIVGTWDTGSQWAFLILIAYGAYLAFCKSLHYISVVIHGWPPAPDYLPEWDEDDEE